MNELNKRLAEFAGFKEADIKKHYYWEIGGTRVAKWIEPKSDYHSRLPNFTDNLNACFKWLVPRAGHVKLEHIICIDPMGFKKKDYQKPYEFIPDHYFDKESPRYHWYRADILWINEHLIGEAETPALALCKAVEQLVDNERK